MTTNHPVWKVLSSLRLTVICLALGIVLVFLGTLAQVDAGLYQAQSHWFKSFFVWWQPKGSSLRIPIFFGGYTIGLVLLANLLAAHIKRFVWSWRKVGIHLTHFGVILLLVGQLVTDMLSTESSMTFREGETLNYSEDLHQNELAFLTGAENGQNKVVAFSENVISKREEVRNEELPFVTRIKEYHANSEVFSHKDVLATVAQLGMALSKMSGEYASPEGLVEQAQRAMESEGRTQIWRDALKAVGQKETNDIVATADRISKDPALAGKLGAELSARFKKQMLAGFTARGGAMRYVAERMAKGEQVSADNLPSATSSGPGKDLIVVPREEVKTMDERNIPAAIIEVLQDGHSLGEFVVSPWLSGTPFEAGGRQYEAALRFVRYYLPFSLTLERATNEYYRGTEIPKNYQSRVRVDNSQTGEHRNVDIYMNNPLRYSGLTFYQYQMSPGEAMGRSQSSTLEVVHNPSWLTPYFGCGLVALGMIYQFLFHLSSFITKRSAGGRASEKASPTKSRRQLAEANS